MDTGGHDNGEVLPLEGECIYNLGGSTVSLYQYNNYTDTNYII